MSPQLLKSRVQNRGGPRASGDEPGGSADAIARAEWSPRERG